MPGRQPAKGRPQFGEGKIDSLAAALAIKVVVVGCLAQVHDPGPVAEMDMMEESRPFQGFESPIDGGEIDAGAGALDFAQEVSRGEVLVMGTRQHPTNRPAGGREPETIGSQRSFEVLGANVHPTEIVTGGPSHPFPARSIETVVLDRSNLGALIQLLC